MDNWHKDGVSEPSNENDDLENEYLDNEYLDNEDLDNKDLDNEDLNNENLDNENLDNEGLDNEYEGKINEKDNMPKRSKESADSACGSDEDLLKNGKTLYEDDTKYSEQSDEL